ncbi:hypothetical protein BC941DRAFT_505600 [Chlamydoabsidia padenii]|nr:hypothetical protein BC941DRAFT_505600 [Chlamydoabsidia padenii]
MFTFHLWTLFMMMGMVVVKPTWAQTTCAAEANFQGCKAIQETKLSGCPPADYACMCTAHKLIQECYNLCPSYATDASIHDGTVKSICGAVPSSSSSSMAIPTLVAAASSSTHPSSLPSASPSSPIQQVV